MLGLEKCLHIECDLMKYNAVRIRCGSERRVTEADLIPA